MLGLILICWPFLEIAGFIYVGSHIGIMETLALTLLSMAVGAALLRIQGIAVLRKMRGEIMAGRMPAAQLGHGALIALAGVLLVIPGFVSDIIGLLLFLPPVRSLLLVILARRVTIVVKTSQSAGIIDLEQGDWHEATGAGGRTSSDHTAPRRLAGPGEPKPTDA